MTGQTLQRGFVQLTLGIGLLALVIGAVIRHFYNTRHKGLPSPWWAWGVAAVLMIIVMLLSAAGPSTYEAAAAPPTEPVSFAQAEEVVPRFLQQAEKQALQIGRAHV